jgi:hypothetical protein
MGARSSISRKIIMAVKPITSKAAGSCVKNSLLKQTDKNKPVDITTQTGNISTVSESSQPISTAGNYDIIGDKTTTTTTNPGTEGSTTYSTEKIDQAKGGKQATDKNRYFKGLHKRFGNNVTTQELIDKKFISSDAAADYEKVTGGKNKGVATVNPGTKPTETKEVEKSPEYETVKGSGTLDVRGDFRRAQIAQRTSGKMAKKALKFEKKAARLAKRGKTDKAAIFTNKAEDSRKASQRLRNKQDQFDIQEKQGGTGNSSYSTIKNRESLDAAKRRISGKKEYDFGSIGSTNLSTEPTTNNTLELGKRLGFLDPKSFLKKNYFKK